LLDLAQLIAIRWLVNLAGTALLAKYLMLKSAHYTSNKFNQNPQVQAWIANIEAQLPLAISLRWTHACKAQRDIYDERGCSKDLHCYWNSVDRLIYGDDWREKKVKRLIVLENTDGRNWHAHGLCGIGRYSVEKMRLILMEKWATHMKIEESNRHTHRHLFWAEQSKGNYGAYILKHIGNGTRTYGHAGVIDAENTFLG
jgi:hypothetical protein